MMFKEKSLITFLVVVYLIIISSIIYNRRSKASDQPNQYQTVTFWHAGAGKERVKTIKELIQKFEEENPEIKIKLKIIPWDQKPHEKIQIAIASKTEPDIASVGTPFDQIISDFNAVESLDKYMDKETIDDFININRNQNKIVSVPWFTDVRALIYRKDLLAKKGIPEPTESWTWEEFIRYASALTEDNNNDGITDIFGYATTARYAYQFVVFMWQNGSDLYSNDGKKAIVASEQSIEAVQFFVDLMKKHKVSPIFTTENLLIIRKMFAEGKIAMFMDCSDAANALTSEPALTGKIGVGQIPHNKKFAAYANSDALVIFRRSKNKKNAAKLLNFLIRPDNMLFYDKKTGFSPSRRSVADNPFFDKYPIKKAFIKQSACGKPWRMPPFTPSPRLILTRNIQMAIEGKFSVKEALLKAEKKMNSEIGSLF
ncbi:hypothetical protein DRQ07_04095 [candidate division KSB1 bacterium]|nr:MAG: hypothetical protein DRQ07_04095 [candidate division KSB1 bacterium]